MTFTPKSKLPRLSRECYQGRAVAFWTHTFEGRATGWLDERFHASFREVLLHACGRYRLACPLYVLMPDHWHFLWMGLKAQSDQRLATAFLRKYLQVKLGSAKLQDRPHDHVLKESECERRVFQATCEYIKQNPLRAGLCEESNEWPYLGAMVTGYPDLDPRREDHWNKFWKIYNRLIEEGDWSA